MSSCTLIANYYNLSALNKQHLSKKQSYTIKNCALYHKNYENFQNIQHIQPFIDDSLQIKLKSILSNPLLYTRLSSMFLTNFSETT